MRFRSGRQKVAPMLEVSKAQIHPERIQPASDLLSKLELVALCCCWCLTYLPLVQQEIWIALFIRTGFLTAIQAGHVAAAEQTCIALGTFGAALLQKRLNLRYGI